MYLGNLRYSWLWVELGTRAYLILEVSLGFLSLFVSVHVSTLASFCCPVERFPPCDLERWPVSSLKFKISQNCDSKGQEELCLIWTNIAVTWRTLTGPLGSWAHLSLTKSLLLEVLRPWLAWHSPLLTPCQHPVMGGELSQRREGMLLPQV